MRKRVIVLIVVGLLCVPVTLSIMYNIFHMPFDVPLQGYTDKTVKPEMNWQSIIEGIYFPQFGSWLDQELKPRGVLTKTYSTIQYWIARKGNNIIVGKNNDLFSPDYVNGELCINGWPDYSSAEMQEEMAAYIDKLVLLKQKLQAVKKKLIVLVSPSKANFHYDNLPSKYVDLSSPESINAVECFGTMIAKTDIPYVIARDMKDQLQYPAFYRTGIHWSQTFEKEIRREVITKLSEGQTYPYRNSVIDRVVQTQTPIYTDSDIYNLLNTWGGDTETYYDYEEHLEELEMFNNVKILVQGTSFGDGFRLDLSKTYPFGRVFYINRNAYMIDENTNTIPFSNWSDLDFEYYLNNVDIVLIESTEHEIHLHQHGFVDYLLDYLDHFTPATPEQDALKEVESRNKEFVYSKAVKGLFDGGENFALAQKECNITLNDPNILSNGLKVSFEIPSYLFIDEQTPDTITVWINGQRVFSQSYDSPMQYTEHIAPEILQQIEKRADGTFEIEIHASKTFIMQQLGLGDDSRELAYVLFYVGGDD